MKRNAVPVLCTLLLVLAGAASSQEARPGPLAPLAHRVGGQWVSTVTTKGGEDVRIVRRYK
jgi:hypothetical protein